MPSDVLQIGDWTQDLDTTIDVGAETGDENVEFTVRSVHKSLLMELSNVCDCDGGLAL